MVKSMTGFGRGEARDDARKITVEIKSVNHRYLDLNIKLPRKLYAYEAQVRNYLKTYVFRGKVDVYISLEESAESTMALKYNHQIAAMYVKNIREISREFDLPYDITAGRLASMPDVFEREELPEDEEGLSALLQEALETAMEPFVVSREQEGERLAEDLQEKLKEMASYVGFLKQRSPEIVCEYTTRLREKIAALSADTSLDEGRIATEIVLYADKVCIDEEMVRLSSHVKEMRHMLGQCQQAGRKLDFIAQEMNREANTILSKSTDAQIAEVGISLKTLIEKIREQIQNLE